MPASSVTAAATWGVYLGVAAALIAGMSPHLSQVQSAAGRSAAARALDGVTAVLDGLRPGIRANISFGSEGGAGGILLGGHAITFAGQEPELTAQCSWSLPYYVLEPGRVYSVSLDGSEVSVTRLV